MPNKRYIVRLSKPERETLLSLVNKGKRSAQLLRRAQILLKLDQGEEGPAWTDAKAAEAFNVTTVTCSQIRQHFVERGFEACLQRKKRKKPPRAILLDGEKEAKLIAIACSEPPQGHAKWTFRLLAKKLVELEIVDSIAHETVRRALKKINSNPTSENTG
jgi:hypothetical protein